MKEIELDSVQENLARAPDGALRLDAQRKRRLIVAVANSVFAHVDELTALDAAIVNQARRATDPRAMHRATAIRTINALICS